MSTVDDKPRITYAGSCPCGTDEHASGHVIGIWEGPFNYYVFVGTGTGECDYNLDMFLKADWIEGPYEGVGRLAHANGNHLARALWAFAVDFRGTPMQRTPDTFDIEKIAFDNEAFYNRQYYLSPALGVAVGDFLFALYPRAEFAGSFVPDGTVARFTDGETQLFYRAGFVLAGMFAKAKNLHEPARVEIVDGAKVIGSLRLKPDANGAAEAMLWLEDCPTPAPLTVRLATPARFSGIGSISVEFTEQLEYKPQPWDAYLLSRLAATAGGTAFGAGVDGRGRDYAQAQEISDDFFTNGCVVNRTGVAAVRDIAEWVNDNPVYDAARRLSRDHARIVRRQNLICYEVNGGKSILRFKRFAFGLNNTRADMFANIAPPLDPVASGELIEGETYIVRTTNGQIAYAGNLYGNDQTFVALGSTGDPPVRRGDSPGSFQATGDAQIFVHDGIRHAALKQGFTNEWVLFIEAKRYHPSETSIWKPDAYSDYFTWCQRCHFFSGTAPPALRRHVSYNYNIGLDADTFMPIRNPMSVQFQFIAPEAPDQYNYTLGANRSYGSDNFYSSCRVYEAPYEIESCVVDDWAPDQIIKVTLKQRLRSHPDAPAAVNKDPSTWSADEVQQLRNEYATDPEINEDYRTDDNTVREYVLHQADPTKQCSVKTGDSGTASGVDGLPDNPFGCCYPHFFFCHLLPEVYEDNNDVMESHDTRAVIDSMLQAEIYLRAMCEGFVDGLTSQDITCRTGEGNLYDYRFENLCFDAFKGREIGCFPLAKRIDASGFGPLPNSIMYAELFNRLVKAVNLLDKVRLDLPMVFKFRTYDYRDDRAVALTELDGTNCTTVGTCKAYGDGLSGVASTLNEDSPSDWATWTTIGASKTGQLVGCPYALAIVRSDAEYRAEIDPDFWLAVPVEILDLVNLGSTGFLAVRTIQQVGQRREAVSDDDADRCPTDPPSGPPFWINDGQAFRWVDEVVETVECVLVKSGLLEAPPLLPSDLKIGRTGAIPEGGFCGNLASSATRLDLIAEQGAFLIISEV